MRHILAGSALASLLLCAPAAAQRVNAENYLSHVPSAGRIVGEARGTVRFGLYGDPDAPG